MNLINIKQASEIAKIRPQTLYKMVNAPGCKIKVYRLSKKIFRLEKEEFEAWIKDQGGDEK